MPVTFIRLTAIIVAVALLLGVGPACAAPVRLYILAGQSNAVGFGSDARELPPALAVPQSDVLFWYEEGPWDSVTQPGRRIASPGWIELQYQTDPINGTFGGPTDGFGPEMMLGRTLADSLPEPIGIVKFAINATSLAEDWDPDAPSLLYADLLRVVDTALSNLGASGQAGQVYGMCWMQGEWDARDPAFAESYQANLTAFLERLRSDLGVPGLPFVLGRLNRDIHLSPYGIDPADLQTVREAQQGVAGSGSWTALVDSDDLPLNGDSIHFSAAGQLGLGQRFAEALLPLQSFVLREPVAAPVGPTAVALAFSDGLTPYMPADLSASWEDPDPSPPLSDPTRPLILYQAQDPTHPVIALSKSLALGTIRVYAID